MSTSFLRATGKQREPGAIVLSAGSKIGKPGRPDYYTSEKFDRVK
jgi:hypothetical protein